MAYRVLTLLEKINVEKKFGITGGIAKNQGVVKRLTKKLGIEAVEQQWHNKAYGEKNVPFDTQIAGAVGAALFGRSLAEKGGK
jgi:activator of 2-hydroxyglutaryl-CoA dehydratase